ncbi:FAD-binding and (Fe-S)-binding domain-containing protein [Selenihalanaerobacter shriftii]|uniref:D-lactate dehydrogenase (cytochrome) n=1 Tax=Selenihalanaerobacter shriftii TaxID=142842 RepID=A0A1T4N761_9FIRM|nr:FAD-binding and (Fe-S)-binding domain-containing protein [Selenihalanaerobacter shriftii]SJZ75054.1 FAD/FMN-containing dehydrogenase [Selenihalanaerobacter shriftii]
MLTSDVKNNLESIFNDRVKFDQIERVVYSHDMGTLPDAIEAIIDSIPDGVVQPQTIEEVQQIVKLAQTKDIPLIPRGAGTSGYGGAIPTKKGIVVDFTRMQRIINVDNEGKTVTVEAGVLWQELEDYLYQHDLALRLYPTSAPGATVGGWIAEGGSGIGSYEYGFIKDNIISLKVVTPQGEIKEFSGDKLDLVCSLEGITGFIVEATIKVREKVNNYPMVGTFGTIEDLANAIMDIQEADIPLWTLNLATSEHIAWKQKAANEYLVPEKYMGTFVLPDNIADEYKEELSEIIEDNNGSLLNEELSFKEWEERFYPMSFKKLGPSLVASESIVPLENLAEFINRVKKKYGEEVALEGFMVGPDKVTLLSFVLSDERKKVMFPLAYTSSLVIMDEAKKLGGENYSIGLYFTAEAEEFYGKKRLNEVWDYKQTVDPNGIFNPGKIIPGTLDKNSPVKLLKTAMKTAKLGTFIYGMAGKLFVKNKPKDFEGYDIPADMAKDTFGCAQCGFCRSVCTVFAADPWESNSPRGKWFLLQQHIKGKINLDEDVAHKLFHCTTCKRCDEICQTNIHLVHHWLAIRPILYQDKGYEISSLDILRDNVMNEENFWAIDNTNRGAWMADDVEYKDEGKVAYWAGCWASYVMDDMAHNVTKVLNEVDEDFVYFGEDETCCGLYLGLGGYYDELGAKIKSNIELFKERGVEKLILSCPGCFASFNDFYPEFAEMLGLEWDIETQHVTDYMAEKIENGELEMTHEIPKTITYHDSCHLGRWSNLYEEPRTILEAIPGSEYKDMKHNREDGLCCGLVAGFTDLDAVQYSGVKRVREAEEINADICVTACAGCGSQIYNTAHALNSDVDVIDISAMVCKALGIEPKESGDNILIFMEKAVELLKTSKVIKKPAEKQAVNK